MKKVVGLLMMFKEDENLKALLQIRGKFDYEKNQPEVWPGICQLTVTGMLEGDEDFRAGLMRETKEELCSEIVSDYLEKNFDKLKILNDIKTQDKHVVNYGLIVNKDLLKEINWHKSSEGGKIISEKDLSIVVDKNNFKIDQGVEDQENITAMYSDQAEALEKAFKILAI